jgi:hypothetical protein
VSRKLIDKTIKNIQKDLRKSTEAFSKLLEDAPSTSLNYAGCVAECALCHLPVPMDAIASEGSRYAYLGPAYTSCCGRTMQRCIEAVRHSPASPAKCSVTGQVDSTSVASSGA